ncbi:hypothetical protein Tco_0319067 [Tanacetum coccineum]
MIDWLSIVETDKLVHTVATDIVKLVVEIKSFGMSSDKFGKESVSSDELTTKASGSGVTLALNELHSHEIHVFPNVHVIE